MKTKEQVELLKDNWKYDPCWDIEDTEEFGEYKEELLEFRLQMEEEWESRENSRLSMRAEKLQCSIELVEYLETLERKIKDLEEAR